jgi:hypothetical protein
MSVLKEPLAIERRRCSAELLSRPSRQAQIQVLHRMIESLFKSDRDIELLIVIAAAKAALEISLFPLDHSISA